MELSFTKMHGLGNDFVVIDGVTQDIALSTAQIRALANRNFGVGCDQILLVEPPSAPDQDFKYRIFNASGDEVEQCGNGARCFAKFVRDRKLTFKKSIRVETNGGNIILHCQENGDVRVDMGAPNFSPADIPLQLLQKQATPQAQQYTTQLEQQTVTFAAVSMGNPHAVIRVNDAATANVAELGPQLSRHACFPQQCNVGFMEIINPQQIRLRVYERGAGETLACGTGACAAVVSGIEQGLLSSPVQVDLTAGSLQIAYDGGDNTVIMTGPATAVFEGKIII
ncbi:MAG: diaminopimelate epimerase [Moraxellaceae bacterium]|nr:MAG: diaminopimelate epimerase [Moraxellaceae bacterium]